jgi:16S rRNA processing protein RimM
LNAAGARHSRNDNADPPRLAAARRVILGRIGAPFGVLGWAKVNSFSEQPKTLLQYTHWQLGQRGAWRAVRVLDARIHGEHLIARLDGCADRDAASRLTGADVAVFRDQLPQLAEGEYYWTDLEGLRVVRLDGEVLGLVESLLATGANDVLVVRGDRERLIPFLLGTVVIEVDLEGGVLRVDWDPNG